MNIGIEAQRLFRVKKHGMEIVTLNLIKSLQDIDDINYYNIFVKDDLDNNCLQDSNNFNINIIDGKYFPIWEQFSLPSKINNFNLDVLHCTSNTAPIAAKFKNLLVTIHDIIYLESFITTGTYYQVFGNLYRRIVVPKVINKADIIITVSEYEKGKICEYFNLPDSKVKVVYNGISSQFKILANNELTTIKNKYDLPNNFILFFGNAAPKKNMRRLLEAYILYYERSNDALPLVILDSNASEIQKLLNRKIESNLNKHILILDYVSKYEMPIFYNLATIYIYPSIRESFGLPIIEAMSCGTPVITSNTSSMPEVSGNAAVLVDPYDIESIANEMKNLSESQGLRDSLITKGLIQAKLFSWKNTASDYLKIYNLFS